MLRLVLQPLVMRNAMCWETKQPHLLPSAPQPAILTLIFPLFHPCPCAQLTHPSTPWPRALPTMTSTPCPPPTCSPRRSCSSLPCSPTPRPPQLSCFDARLPLPLPHPLAHLDTHLGLFPPHSRSGCGAGWKPGVSCPRRAPWVWERCVDQVGGQRAVRRGAGGQHTGKLAA